MIKINYKLNYFPKFILKRFTRIELPYIAVVILGIIYLLVRNYVPLANNVDITPSIRDVFLHIGYLVPFFEDAKWINPVFWTLSVEFQYYLMLAIAFPLALSSKQYLRIAFYILILLFPFVINTGQSFLPYWGAYFSVGIFYALFITNKISKIEYATISLFAALIIYYNQGLIDLSIAIVTLLIIHNFSKFTNKLGEFFGKISYSVYLLHSIVGSAFVNYMSHIYKEPYQKIIVITSGVLITIISAYIFWILIERPSQKLAKKIK